MNIEISIDPKSYNLVDCNGIYFGIHYFYKIIKILFIWTVYIFIFPDKSGPSNWLYHFCDREFLNQKNL